MKDSHLTLRLPRELARALAQWARERGLPKSLVAREAVARYLAPSPAALNRTLSAAELAARWPAVPRLAAEEAAAFAADVEAGRRSPPAPGGAWE